MSGEIAGEQTSQSSLAKALAAFQAEIPRVGKNASATVQGGRQHRYGDLAAVTKETLFFLGRHGLSFIAKPTMHPEHGFVLSYALLHESGEAERGLYPLPQQGSPQTIGSAITYARRYCLCAVTGVAPDDDDDDAAEAERAHRADGLPVNRDGSLSRSRTTDEEKEAAGVMTAGQQAEHTALQPKRAEQTGRVTRIGTTTIAAAGDPEANPWIDQPAGALPVPAEDQPGTIDPKDQRAIMAAVGRMERGERLAKFAAIVGRPVASTNELSFQEGRRVRDKLKGAAT